MKRIVFILWCAFAVFSGYSASFGADEIITTNDTNITNTISVNASSGGIQGESTTGTATTHVFIDTTVNGETVQHIDQTKESQNGSAFISVSAKYENGTSTVDVQATSDHENTNDVNVTSFDQLIGNTINVASLETQILHEDSITKQKGQEIAQKDIAETVKKSVFQSLYKGLALFMVTTITIYALTIFFI